MTGHEKYGVVLIAGEDSAPEGAVMRSEVVDDIHHTVIDGQEAWVRNSTEPHLRSVEAVKNDSGGGWSVVVAVMELVRPEHAVYQELWQAIEDAIKSVPGVTEVEREVNDAWWAMGTPSGADLARAVARVLDERADRLRDNHNNYTPAIHSS